MTIKIFRYDDKNLTGKGVTMLFNFIITREGQSTLYDSNYMTVDAVSRDDAIQIFILNDSLETRNIIKLIYNADYFGLESGEPYKIATNLCSIFEKSTGFQLLDIEEGNIDDEVYNQLLHDNLDEITKLINKISHYFAIFELSHIVTGSSTKSARKI